MHEISSIITFISKFSISKKSEQCFIRFSVGERPPIKVFINLGIYTYVVHIENRNRIYLLEGCGVSTIVDLETERIDLGVEYKKLADRYKVDDIYCAIGRLTVPYGYTEKSKHQWAWQ